MSSSAYEGEEVEGTPILLEFVGPTGRIYLAGGMIGPLITKGQPEAVDPRTVEGLGIKLTGIKVVMDG